MTVARAVHLKSFVNACKSLQPVSSSSRPCANKVQEARSKLFMGMYDASTGFGSPGASVVRCPRCKRTVGNVTGAGWRQATCDTCGGSLRCASSTATASASRRFSF